MTLVRPTRLKSSRVKRREYQCSRCPFQTSQRSELREHKARGHKASRAAEDTGGGSVSAGTGIGTGTELFQCEQCEFCTRSAGSFRQHKYTHEEPKFFCDQCEYATTRRYHLKRHLQSVHEGVKHPCHQCDFQASDRRLAILFSSLIIFIQSNLN